MAIQSLLIILLGSVLHLAWNILTKKSRDQFVFLWLALTVPALFGAFFLATKSYSQTTHFYFVATAIIHSIYFYTLAISYKFADLSFVYPYARGVGTMVATIGGILFLRERPSSIGFLGIGLTLFGTMLEPVTKIKKGSKNFDIKGVIFTVLTGVMIGSYLVLDTNGIRTVENSYEYVSIMFLYSVLLLFPFVFRNKRIQLEFAYSKWMPFFGSLFMASAYGIILLAMQTTPVSYTVSARASGIILSAVYGKMILNEIVDKSRMMAIFLIMIGVICLAYA